LLPLPPDAVYEGVVDEEEWVIGRGHCVVLQ
jgi:hypothetical protein